MDAVNETDLQSGTRIEGGYRIVRRIHAGGMGTVYEATGPLAGQRYALKTVNRTLRDNPRLLERFKEEASHLTRVRSDAVVRSLGFIEDQALGLFLVMEYVDGETLDQFVKTHGALSEPQLKQLRRRLAEALADIHREGIVHRDLSPDNIVLPDGNAGRAKLIDLGISKPPDAMRDGEERSRWPEGKFLWMAPEQFGRGEIGEAADHYSAALVLAYAAIGSPLPLAATSPQQAIEKRQQSIDLSRVPKWLQPQLRRLLHPSPRWRGRLKADDRHRVMRRAALILLLCIASGVAVYEVGYPPGPPVKPQHPPDTPPPARPPLQPPVQPPLQPPLKQPPLISPPVVQPRPLPIERMPPGPQPSKVEVPTCTNQAELKGPGWIISQKAPGRSDTVKTESRVNTSAATIDLRAPRAGEVVAEGYVNLTENSNVDVSMQPIGDTSAVYCYNVRMELGEAHAVQTNWFGIRAKNGNSYAFAIKPAMLNAQMARGPHPIRLIAACTANAFPQVGVQIRIGNTLMHPPGQDDICRAASAAAPELAIPTATPDAEPPLVRCDQLPGMEGSDGWLVTPWAGVARRTPPDIIDFAALPQSNGVLGQLSARGVLQLPTDGTVVLDFALADPTQAVMCSAQLTIDQLQGRGGFQGGGATWRTLPYATNDPNPRRPIHTAIPLNRGIHYLDLRLTTCQGNAQGSGYLPTVRFSIRTPSDSGLRGPKPNELCVPESAR